MLLAKHRFHYAAKTGFELSLSSRTRGSHICSQVLQPENSAKEKKSKNLHEESFPQLQPQVSLRVEIEIRPHERLSSPLNLSSLVELQISQKKKNQERTSLWTAQDTILSESESPSAAKIMRNKNHNDLILKAVNILAHIFLSARQMPC